MRILLFVLPGVAAAALAWLFTPLARRLAVRVGAVDRPAARKIHAVPTPRLGGLAVVAAAAVVLAVLGFSASLVGGGALWLGLGLGLVPILVVSVVDDVKGLTAGRKFFGHLAGALIAVSLGVTLGDRVHLFGGAIHIGLLAYPLSILWLIGITNAFNLVDGLDGLSAGLALISAGSLIPVFVFAHQPGAAVAALVLAGALVGFLPYNLYPAKIFLGDTGATAIGFTLACLSLRGGSTISAGFATLLPVVVLGVPIVDTLISMARRLFRAAGRDPHSMFVADCAHMHHRLLALGLDQRRAVMILYGVGLALASLGLLSVLMTAQEVGLLLLGLFLAAFVGVARLGYQEFGFIRSGFALRLYDAPVLHRSLFVAFVDLVFVVVSVYAAIGLKYDDWALLRYRPLAFAMASVLVPSTVVVLWLMRLYRGSWRLASVYDIIRLGVAVSVASLVGFLAIRPASGQPVPLSLFLIYAMVKMDVATTSRLSYRVLAFSRSHASVAGVRALIYGAGQGGASALREMLANPGVGLRAVGFIDDAPDCQGRTVNGVPVVGTIDGLEACLKARRAEVLVVSTRKVPAERIALARAACERARSVSE
jgi:UDP-GlcNAc:undecaprenyl-phosphate GlcNAc-1-phosphate transferase